MHRNCGIDGIVLPAAAHRVVQMNPSGTTDPSKQGGLGAPMIRGATHGVPTRLQTKLGGWSSESKQRRCGTDGAKPGSH
jgi:hypothetical protein